MSTKVNCEIGACADRSASAANRHKRLQKVQMLPTKMLR